MFSFKLNNTTNKNKWSIYFIDWAVFKPFKLHEIGALFHWPHLYIDSINLNLVSIKKCFFVSHARLSKLIYYAKIPHIDNIGILFRLPQIVAHTICLFSRKSFVVRKYSCCFRLVTMVDSDWSHFRKLTKLLIHIFHQNI